MNKVVMRNRVALAWGVAIVLVSGAGCGSDLYAPCTLSESANSVQERACAGDNEFSCAIEGDTDCETRICARFEGSSPFCTITCGDDADCGDSGVCLELVVQSGRKYCVQTSQFDAMSM